MGLWTHWWRILLSSRWWPCTAAACLLFGWKLLQGEIEITSPHNNISQKANKYARCWICIRILCSAGLHYAAAFQSSSVVRCQSVIGCVVMPSHPMMLCVQQKASASEAVFYRQPRNNCWFTWTRQRMTSTWTWDRWIDRSALWTGRIARRPALDA